VALEFLKSTLMCCKFFY